MTFNRKAHEETLARVNSYIAELESARFRLQNVILDKGYIIQVAGVSMAFPLEEGAPKPAPCGPHQATRFRREDAEAVARFVSNGNGSRGETVHVVDALNRALMQQIKNSHDLKEAIDAHTRSESDGPAA